jgi:zinc protease
MKTHGRIPMQALRTITLAAAAVAAFAAPAAAQPLPAARQVIDRYVEAIGGREAAQRIQSRRLVYEISAGGMTISMDIKQRRPNLGIVVMSTPMGEMRSGFDGSTGWSMSPAGPDILEGTQAEESRIRAAFDADILFDVYETVETTERAEYAGKACYKVRMVSAAGSESFRCFDVDTGLMVAVEASQNGMPVTAVYEEYREFGGLKYPARFTSSAMGQEAVTTLVTVEHTDIPASEFVAPDAIKALQP